jgi:hypothetical protein
MRLRPLYRTIMASETLTPRFKRNIAEISENSLPVEFQCSPALFAKKAQAQFEHMADGTLSLPTNAVTILYTAKSDELIIFARLRERVILDCVAMYFVRGQVRMATEAILIAGPDIIETALFSHDDIFIKAPNTPEDEMAQFGWTAINTLFAILGGINEHAVAFQPVTAKPAKIRQVVIRDRPSPHWRSAHMRRLRTGKTTYIRRTLIRGDEIPVYH